VRAIQEEEEEEEMFGNIFVLTEGGSKRRLEKTS